MLAMERRAEQFLAARRYAEAAPIFARLCSAPDAERKSWFGLANCLLAQDQSDKLMDIVQLRHQQAGDGLSLMQDCLVGTLGTPYRAAAERAIARVPDGTIYSIIAHYSAGLMAICDGETDAGIARIKAAAALVPSVPEAFASDPYLGSIEAEGGLLEPLEQVAALETADRAALLASLGLAPAAQFAAAPAVPPEASFVFLSSCDERYLDKFGATAALALDAAERRTVYHFHVVDAGPALPAKIAAIAARCNHLAIGYSTEHGRAGVTGYQRASFYACSRLLRLPEIFAHYGRDVFMFDMDTEAVRDVGALAAAMAAGDLGYFEMKHTRPTLICHLAAVYFANNPAMRRTASLIGNFILSKLASQAYWLLDQTAVLCAARLMASRAGLRIVDFSTNPGGSFPSHVVVASSATEKQAMRRAAGF